MTKLGLIFLAVLAITTVDGHIRLIYPKARMYDFDFIINFRSRGPCGMPENADGKGIFKTKLITGSTIHIAWHLGFAHQGGFRIQILGRDGIVRHELTPTSDATPWFSSNNATIQHFVANLPAGFTCDHCIVKLIRNIAERATPIRPFQYWSCADVEIANFPCSQLNCYHEGTMASMCNSPSCTCKNHLISGNRCQFVNECETNADCNDQGRCLMINQDYFYPLKQCYCTPGYYGYQCSQISALTTVTPDDFTSYNYFKLDSSSDIWFKVLSSSNEIEVIHKARSITWVGLGWRPQGFMESCQFYPEGAASGLAFGPIDDISAQATEAAKTPVKHSMACTDMVIGSARGNTFRLFDYYSRDRGTPRMDTYYGGNDSLTAAVGSEENGITTLRWRKKLTADGPTDHAIIDSVFDVIYAYGQKIPFTHEKPSGIINTTQETTFYGDDELKYHGFEHRGRHSINLFGGYGQSLTQNLCSGSWSSKCSAGNCDHHLNWNIYNDGTVHFKMSAKTDRWIALGISTDMQMLNSDAIVGWVSDGKVFFRDRYIRTYANPAIDAIDNVKLVNGSLINGITSFNFNRRINTSDAQNDISLHGCHYFFFGVGGAYDSNSQVISPHPTIPAITTVKVCIDGGQCSHIKPPYNSAASISTLGRLLIIAVSLILANIFE